MLEISTQVNASYAASQQLPSIRDTGLLRKGGKIILHDMDELFAFLNAREVPVEYSDPIIIPDDNLIWRFIMRRPQDPTVPRELRYWDVSNPRLRELRDSDIILAARRIRKAKVYMRQRAVAMVSAIQLSPRWTEIDAATAEASIQDLDGWILRDAKFEQSCLDFARHMPTLDVDLWNELCRMIRVFDQGWLMLAGVPLDETVACDNLAQQMGLLDI